MSWCPSIGSSMKNELVIKIEPLSAETFAEFGEILEPREVPNFRLPTKDLHRFPWTTDAPTMFQILSFKPQPILPVRLERHSHVTESRMHIGGSSAVLVVAPPTVARPGPSDIRAFELRGQGIMLKKGTWHSPDAYPTGEQPSQFLFLSDKETQAELFDNPSETPKRTEYTDISASNIRLV